MDGMSGNVLGAGTVRNTGPAPRRALAIRTGSVATASPGSGKGQLDRSTRHNLIGLIYYLAYLLSSPVPQSDSCRRSGRG